MAFFIVPGSGGQEYGRCLVEDRTHVLVGDDAVHLRPQPPGDGGVCELVGLRLSGEPVGMTVAEPT